MSIPTTAEDLAKAHRWHAIECNNRAWQLAEQENRSPEEDGEMLDAAHAAAFHWQKVGNELTTARAAMLLAQVHALLRSGVLAMKYARPSYAYFTSHEAAGWELAFSHAVLAHAAWAAGDAALHKEQYETAESLGNAIASAEEKEIFLATFRTVTKPF